MTRALRGLVLLLLLAPAGASGQSVSAPELKAAFVFNFAKFAEWPTLPPDAPITVCVAGDDRLAAAIADAVRGQTVDARTVAISRIAPDDTVRACQLLFIGGDDGRRASALLAESGSLPVLTVSDAWRFAASSGMIELFLEAGRMRFAVNVDAVRRSRVRLSSRLLGLAKIVRDTHAP